jgi:4-amino-4-deoxy-L-arabinose transferase-like glycosyltransferase
MFVLLILYPGIESTIVHITAIIASVLVFAVIQIRAINSKIKNLFIRAINSKIKNLFINEKIFVIILFFVSILCRIFFINSWKRHLDVEQDMFVVNYILKNGISSYFTNYSTLPHIGPQYPPLYPLLLAVVFPFGITLELINLFTVIVGSLIIISTYFIGKTLYNKRKAVLSAIIMFALPYPFLISFQGLSDIPITFISALFMYFFILYIKNGKIYDGILSGTFLGVGMLFKYTIAIFYLSTILFAMFYKHNKENNILSKTFFVFLVSLLFIIPWIVYMYYTGLIEAQIDLLLRISEPGRHVGGHNGYESHQWLRFLFWSVVLLSPTNIVLLLIFIFNFVYRRKSNWTYFLLLSWVIVPFIFFGILHPYIRYWMISFPALTLLISNSIEDLNREQYRGKIFFTTFVCSLVLCFLASYIVLFYSGGRYFFLV